MQLALGYLAALAPASVVAAGSRCRPGGNGHSSVTSAATKGGTTETVSWGTGFEDIYTSSATDDVAAAAATAKTSSPTSSVKGKAFDRYVTIWFENENYEKAIGDENFAWFAGKGITLTNFFGVTHPSEGNYVSAVCGDYFGMQNDDFNQIALNVSSVVDLLEDKGVSWGMYQEDMPYTGYEGHEWLNQENGANDYVRKHNPGVIPDSIAHYEQRLSQVKNLSMVDAGRSMFHTDLENDELPQWMFITPNMTSDGHDSSATVGGAWLRAFLGPLLEDEKFMKNTLVLVTWDENETYAEQNRILSILLGDAVPVDLVGTEDSSFYNHYSEIATVEANWDLSTLGRFDVGANVFAVVADQTGDTVRDWGAGESSSVVAFDDIFFNLSYAGAFNEEDGGNQQYPAPNLDLDGAGSGRTILQSIKDTWEGSELATYYTDAVEIPDGMHPPDGYAPVV
ncbi:hypothetical protein MKZ38_004285 [Zalerion maritima]|uniref:Acid phosphatase n=1 Tax=Zalerion maritima TaxID=339359 RepID=A0AAD5RSV8_9PEZI|nr:hypothetical protein MKZ38_004285 [Zalerion maritima]